MTGARISPAIPITTNAARQSSREAMKAPINVPPDRPSGIPREKMAMRTRATLGREIISDEGV